MADEADSKSAVRKGVWVRVPPPAPLQTTVVETFSVLMAVFFFSKAFSRWQ